MLYEGFKVDIPRQQGGGPTGTMEKIRHIALDADIRRPVDGKGGVGRGQGSDGGQGTLQLVEAVVDQPPVAEEINMPVTGEIDTAMQGNAYLRTLQGKIADTQMVDFVFQLYINAIKDDELAAVTVFKPERCHRQPVKDNRQRQKAFRQGEGSGVYRGSRRTPFVAQTNDHPGCLKTCHMQCTFQELCRMPIPGKIIDDNLGSGQQQAKFSQLPLPENLSFDRADHNGSATQKAQTFLQHLQTKTACQQQGNEHQQKKRDNKAQTGKGFHQRSPPTIKCTRSGLPSSVMAEATSSRICPNGRRKRTPPPTP